MKPLVPFAAMALLLSGCVSLLPDSGDLPPRLSLEPGENVLTVDAISDHTLVIEDPNSESVYNTYSVAVRTNPMEYNYLAGAEWTDRVPIMWRIYLIRRFENEGLFTAVGDIVDLPRGTMRLRTDIRQFHLDQTGEVPTAVISFSARLETIEGEILGSRIFDVSQPAGLDRATRVSAMNAAAESVSTDVMEWVQSLI